MNKNTILRNLLKLLEPYMGHMNRVELIDDEEWEDYYENYGECIMISLYCLHQRDGFDEALRVVYNQRFPIETGQGGDWYEYILEYKHLNLESLSMDEDAFELWLEMR